MKYNLRQLCLLGHDEQQLRLAKLNVGHPVLICDNANLLYLTGRVFSGYIYLVPGEEPLYFVKRPAELEGERIRYIRKPEEIKDTTGTTPTIGLETGTLPYAEAMRLKNAMGADVITDISGAIMEARAVKTPLEIKLLEQDGIRQREIYARIPGLYSEGMSDLELQIEIERLSRLRGCLGLFRVNGPSMELHMGNVLVGDNADAPSPYDFAMGGAGLDPSIPVGASGETIRHGKSVMVDMNGNFNGYMTDMTRTFACGTLSPQAMKAHSCSIEICAALAAMGKPGTEAKALYEAARQIAERHGLADYFMGHRSHAGFVGHGVGIQINELPVIAPRSRHILAEGNVIALEPKFVIPDTGAVGIENTYVVEAGGMRAITNAPEEIVSLI